MLSLHGLIFGFGKCSACSLPLSLSLSHLHTTDVYYWYKICWTYVHGFVRKCMLIIAVLSWNIGPSCTIQWGKEPVLEILKWVESPSASTESFEYDNMALQHSHFRLLLHRPEYSQSKSVEIVSESFCACQLSAWRSERTDIVTLILTLTRTRGRT